MEEASADDTQLHCSDGWFVAFIDEEGAIREEIIGTNRYVRLTVPPGIWFGFKGFFSPYSMLMNVADIPHDSTEVERKNLHEINYNWKIK